jgi:hypothetical protein
MDNTVKSVFHMLAFTSFNSFHLNKFETMNLNNCYHFGINFVVILDMAELRSYYAFIVYHYCLIKNVSILV